MFDDRGHRPHADFRGETPTTKISRGPEALYVSLEMWGPKDYVPYVYNALQANWGDEPSRIRQLDNGELLDYNTGRVLKTDEVELIDAYVAKCFAGGTLPQILEDFRFHFVIDNVCRACTHQLVRTRGAAVMQHGGRDNDWRHRGWSLPETIARACEPGHPHHCITDWEPLSQLLGGLYGEDTDANLLTAITDHLNRGKDLYAAMVDAGIPWQDARRVLPMGTQTYLHISYSYLDLQRTLANRLEHIMDWEFNCVAQLMLREVCMKCPSMMSDPLMSVSDKAQKAMFAGLTSWPPDGKYPNPFEVCVHCGKKEQDHYGIHCYSAIDMDEVQIQGQSLADTSYQAADSLPRTHTRAQMPFWILAPECYRGMPITWIPTNGIYPEDLPRPR